MNVFQTPLQTFQGSRECSRQLDSLAGRRVVGAPSWTRVPLYPTRTMQSKLLGYAALDPPDTSQKIVRLEDETWDAVF